MAADGRSFGISLGVNCAIALICFLFFGYFRRNKHTIKYYSPKRFLRNTGRKKPRRLPTAFWGWLWPVFQTDQDDVVAMSGMDAAMYLRVMSFGAELFFFITIWVAMTVVPVNLTGSEVNRLLNLKQAAVSDQFTYWIAPPPPFNASAPPQPPAPVAIKAPQFYDPTPPAPPGITWWRYKTGVPPLPDPSTINANFTRYGWRYDADYQSNPYTFSDLDKVTMANVPAKSQRLWVHLISLWVISIYTYKLLWRYNVEAVELRMEYLTHAKHGAESHSVLVRDIPGIEFGTMLHRADSTVLRFLPQPIVRRVKKGMEETYRLADKGLGATVGVVGKGFAPSARKNLSGIPARTATGTIPPVLGVNPGDDGDKFVDASGDLSFSSAKSQLPSRSVSMFEEPLPPRRQTQEVDAWASSRERLIMGMSLPELVDQEMRECYPHEVSSVAVVSDTSALDPLVREYEMLKRELTDLLDDYTSKKRRQKDFKRKQVTVLGLKYGSWGKEKFGVKPRKVDALEWGVARMTELRRAILVEQEATTRKYVPAAFVTFKTRRAQVVASTSMQHHDLRAWTTQAAPGPEEVIWQNLRWRSWERKLRFAAVWAGFVLLTLFFMIPVGAVQALIEVNRLNKLPVFNQLLDVTFIRGILEGIIPGLVLNIFLAILPGLLAFLNKVQGMNSASKVDFGVIRKYFIFQVITVFFGSFLAGSFFSQFEAWTKSPASGVTILGTAAPLTSIFFTTYVLLNALSGTPIGFLRIVGFVIFWLLTQLAGTERAKARQWQNQFASYGALVPSHTITILLGLVFSIINPLMAPACLIYFTVTQITEKYQAVYVLREAYQSGGKIWQQVTGQILTGLLLGQLIMLALLGVKQNAAVTLLAFPLLPITAVYWSTTNAVFKRPQSILSLRSAVDLDARDKVELATAPEAEVKETEQPAAQLYVNPALVFDQAEFDSIVAEAAQMDAVLKGQQQIQPANESEELEVVTPAQSTAGSGHRPRNGRPAVPLSSSEHVEVEIASIDPNAAIPENAAASQPLSPAARNRPEGGSSA